MKFFRYVFYDILASFRAKEGIISMVILPIAFMTLLGFALKNTFVSEVKFNSTKVIYVDNSNEKSKGIFEIFKSEGDKYKIDLNQVEDLEKGREAVKLDNTKILLELKDDQIIVYENSLKGIQVNYVVGVIKSIAQRYALYEEITRVSPEGIKTVDNDFTKDYTEVKEIDLGRTIGSFDYYAIVEITMMVLYGSLFTLYSFVEGRKGGRAQRLTQTGNSKLFYAGGMITSKFIVVIITLIPSFIYSKYALKVYWGGDYLSIAAILLSLNFFAVALGAVIGELFEDEKVSSMMLNSVVMPVLTFLGGGYIYIGEDVNKFLDIATKISPLRWVNRSIVNIIYSGNYEKMPMAIGVNIGLGLLCLAILVMKFKRREA